MKVTKVISLTVLLSLVLTSCAMTGIDTSDDSTNNLSYTNTPVPEQSEPDTSAQTEANSIESDTENTITESTDTEKTVDYGPLKITEENGKKILTCGDTKITAEIIADTNEIKGNVLINYYNTPFTIKDGHIESNIPMDLYAYIEQMYDISIVSVTFGDEGQMLASLGTTPNNVKNIYIDPLGQKNCHSVDGVIYNGSAIKTLVYFPAGRTGEYTVESGTKRILEGAFNATKLTKLYIPSSVTEYKAATENIGITIEIVD